VRKQRILIVTRQFREEINWFQLWCSSLNKYAGLYFTGKGYPEEDLSWICDRFKPDIILVPGIPCRGNTNKYLNNFNNIDALKVCILHDYHVFNKGSNEEHQYKKLSYPKYDKFISKYKFDLYITYNSLVKDYLGEKLNIKVFPLSYDPTYFYNDSKDIDIISSSASNERFYSGRKEIGTFVQSLSDLKIVTKRMKFQYYVDYLRRSKIFINSGSRFANDGVLIKYLECMASETLLLTTKPNNLDDYGFVDGEYLVIYNNFDDLRSKIYYFLEHEEERTKITNKAKRYVSENFTNDIVIQKMLQEISVAKLHLSDT
jgi:glycosyltransferase involved in cell wall biosynthesis